MQRHEPNDNTESPEPSDSHMNTVISSNTLDEQAKVHHAPPRLETMMPVTPLSARASQTSLQSSSQSPSPSSTRQAAAAGGEADLAEASPSAISKVRTTMPMHIEENGEQLNELTISAANIPAAATSENQDDLTLKKAHTEQPSAVATKIVEKAVNPKEEKKLKAERIR